MIYPVMLAGAPSSLVYPSLNAIMSKEAGESQQGELQGALAALTAISEITGPVLMTQTLGYFTGADAPLFFPGAPFVLAAGLGVVALGLLAASGMRKKGAVA